MGRLFNEYRVSFTEDKNISKNHLIMLFRGVNCMVSALYLNRDIKFLNEEREDTEI